MDDQTKALSARIAATVRELQREAGVSTADLARRSGIEFAELEAILADEVEIPLPAIYLIAGALGVRPGRLLDGVEWVPAEGGGGSFGVGGAGD